MNSKKIAFILCVSNLEQYAECKRYIDSLIVPEGYETDVIAIQEAPSMCEGYNAGMEATDAKYKVYMHQDVCIVNKNFIADLLDVFDEEVGLVGMVGARRMPDNAYAVSAWDTGKVYFNSDTYRIEGYEEPGKKYTEVEAVDGLLFATQYDVRFREDIFTEFDFYDISAAFEYRRAGYKVVVPKQEEPWTYHNDKFSKMSRYDENRRKFLDEYRGDFGLSEGFEPMYKPQYENALREMISSFEEMIDAGKMEAVSNAVLNNGAQFSGMKDLVILSMMYVKEKESGCITFPWYDGVEQLYLRLGYLRDFLKRVEYDIEMDKEEYELFCSNYSVSSIVIATSVYCMKSKKVMMKIARYTKDKHVIENVINKLTDDFPMIDVLKFSADVKKYNIDKLTKLSNVPVALEHLDSEQCAEDLYNLFKQKGLEKNIVIFSPKDGAGAKFLEKKGVPVIIGGTSNIKIYSMELKWCIDMAFYVGEGTFVKEFERLYANSKILVSKTEI
ncbi:MAG: hypothetical protein E7266_02970 [Lachnospiraceae bacterium]|nr:hypothetical protein [Lachnospiraceae bacterium]